MSFKKIQFLLYKGKNSGLFNSAKFICDFFKQSSNYIFDISIVDDISDIDNIVSKFNPDIVIAEALWIPPSKFLELFSNLEHSKRKWIVRIHSKAPFLSNDIVATTWVKEYCKISTIIISPNTEELTNQLKITFPEGHFLYLPNIYLSSDLEENYFKENKNDSISIGCFGAIRPLKNHYAQALAAIEFAESINKKLNFHINSKVEQQGESVLKNLEALFSNGKHNLIKHPWYSHSDFMKIAANLDLGMQVSFSESFNIVTADLITAKIPMIVSKDINWMSFLNKVSPTSHKEIVFRLKLAYFLPWLFLLHQEKALKYYNVTSQKLWTNALK